MICFCLFTVGVGWQLSNQKIWSNSCQTEKFHVFFCMQLCRSIWSSAGTLFLNEKHSILELIFRKLQTISKRSQPASFFLLLIRNATFWVLMKICVKHQDQRVDFFVDFDQRGINAKSVVLFSYREKIDII